jgi:hypothetical protein
LSGIKAEAKVLEVIGLYKQVSIEYDEFLSMFDRKR